MEDTDETGVTFLEAIDSHDRAENNNEISSDEYSQNSLSFLGIVEEDFTVGKAVDGDTGHAETDD